MNLPTRQLFAAAVIAVIIPSVAVMAQTSPATADNPTVQHQNHAAPTAKAGPHGGSLRLVSGVQIETVVTQAGITLFVYNRAGQAVVVDKGRGFASLLPQGSAKRYRYDLLPDGKGALTAPVNLSNITGSQIELDFQLVGISTENSRVTFHEVAMVPPNEMQLAAAAIARQKICPVSGKPLGSMGQAVAVDVGGDRVYVCCAGCASAVKADPAKYASGRPQITVTTATQADAALIKRQAKCPVMDESLGSMGQPIKVMVGDKPIFLCCKGCIKKIKAEPAKYLAMVYGTPALSQTAGPSAGVTVPSGSDQVRPGVFKVSTADKPFIAAQKRCPVMDEPLDAMGGPYRVNADGKAIYICCPGCAKKIAAEPQKYLGILTQQGINAPLLR